MKELLHPDIENINLYTVLSALGDPIRLYIVNCLYKENKICNSFDVNIAKNTLTHHFKVLRDSGIIKVECIGTKRILSLRKTELDNKFPGLIDSILINSNK